MNPLSRSMRLVRLAQQQVVIETAANMLEESYEAAGRTPQEQQEKEAETSLNDISLTELVPVTGLDNAILINEPNLQDDVDSFNCYLPNVHAKGNIFTNGNLVTNTPLLSVSYNNVPLSPEANILQPSRPDQKATADDESCSEDQDHHNTAPNDKDKDTDKDSTASVAIETDQHQGHSEDQDQDNVEDDCVPTASTFNEAAQTQEGMSKKRKADPKTWIKNINAQKRSRGQAYMGRKYEKDSAKFVIVEKPSKVLGERCHCKTSGVKCLEVTDETRAKIHKEVWCMSWPQREILVKSLVHKCNVGRHRVLQSESGRQNTLKYNLNIGSGLVLVCKKMFLSTTGITQHFIRANVCECKLSDQEEQQPKPSATSSNRTAIKEFLASLATMPAHYCRKSSSKKYIERSFNSKMEVYKEYQNWSKDRQLPIASRQVFVDEFDAGNFAIFRPRKDQCDVCVSYTEGNVDEATYTMHRLRKDMAQKAKEDDKKRASESGGKVKMITMDLQAVLLAPALKASALYYRTKLCVHNFTIYDCTTRDVACYVWHEAEGGLTAHEFASCLCHYIESNLTPKEFVIFSDGCPYQNRNSTLSKALTHLAQTRNITITHKFLEKGHTQMEVDSVHHMIEEKLKNKYVYCPSDYVRFIKEARQNPCPYRVEYLDYSFFKDYTEVCGLKSIRPGRKPGDAQVADIRCLQYTPEGCILFKLVHDEEWKELIVRGNSTSIKNQPKPLFTCQRQITAAKFKHLQELKPVIPKDIHGFYDSLPHE